MFQYECEKSRRDWDRGYPSGDGAARAWPSAIEVGRSPAPSDAGAASSHSHSRRALPLPPRPTVVCKRLHTATKPTVPLKVWVVASASCFAVCAALVLATVVITRWGSGDSFGAPRYVEQPVPVYSQPQPAYPEASEPPKNTPDTTTDKDWSSSEELEREIQYPMLEKLALFKNIVSNREKGKKTQDKESLVGKVQIHPLHDQTHEHEERKIQKKHEAIHPHSIEKNGVSKNQKIPDFKPTLPDVFVANNLDIKLPEGFGFRKYEQEYDTEYYNDENLYDDYMQSNTMTSYLIEKVQELHDWITTDADFDVLSDRTEKKMKKPRNEFSQVLKALNESLTEGNVTIIMNKLKDIYFGENYTNANHTRKVILSNSTDLLSFGILSLDVMLLHNIQLMAWENQESARAKMLKDPDVFAFNALFLDPSKVEGRHNALFLDQSKEARHNEPYSQHENTAPNAKYKNLRTDIDDFDLSRNLLENVLEIGMSTARAAIHLGRAYKNTKMVLSQLSNREALGTNIQNHISRNIDGNAHALNHLESSYISNNSTGAMNETGFLTELDCVWLLYCKNLLATAKLNAPYGLMARINGVALRLLTGELSADKALDTMLYESLTGWTDLRCNQMFPRCSKVDAASVVLESILQPLKKSQSGNKSR